MKTYQEDFFIEREAKDCLAAEKATLSQQLTFMHNRNQQLEYTIDRFQSTDDYENWYDFFLHIYIYIYLSI